VLYSVDERKTRSIQSTSNSGQHSLPTTDTVDLFSATGVSH
jgi:hypothetical protein